MTPLHELDKELEALLADDRPHTHYAADKGPSLARAPDWEARIAALEAQVARLDPEAIKAQTHCAILDACMEAARKVQTLVHSTHPPQHRPHTR
jgi:hypothetical protein